MRRYCLGQVNPTDLLTREVSMYKLLSNSTWRHGPEWLSEWLDRWPVWPQQPISTDDRIMCEITAVHIAISSEPKARSPLDIESYSIVKQLLMVIAWIFRFIEHCWRKDGAHTGFLVAKEIPNAEKCCIGHVHHLALSKDICSTSAGRSSKATSHLKDLNPFLDANSILWIGGCLLHLDASEEVKKPSYPSSQSSLF